ncbi:MAG: hypothetical protein RLN85_22280, partial [Pseudomonadales bacterium]
SFAKYSLRIRGLFLHPPALFKVEIHSYRKHNHFVKTKNRTRWDMFIKALSTIGLTLSLAGCVTGQGTTDAGGRSISL